MVKFTANKIITINLSKMTKYQAIFLFLLTYLCIPIATNAQQREESNVIDKVIWVVGDEAITLGKVEEERLALLAYGEKIEGDPYCTIPEELAVKMLFMDQAKIDSIFIPKSSLSKEVQRQENLMIANAGGTREKLEELRQMSMSQIRAQIYEYIETQQIVNEVRASLTKDVSLTPSEVRKYYSQLPQDSLPFIQTSVEVQVLVNQPKVPIEEIDAVKSRLRDFTNKVNSGESDFTTLAMLYSEDLGSAMNGGELGFNTRATLDPAFANVGFSLTDPKKVSNIVESEYGYHIIQLIERRGERANLRHILLKPKVPYTEIEKSKTNLQRVSDSIKSGVFPFEEAVLFLSTDKDTRNNNGLMVNQKMGMDGYPVATSKFLMEELPTPIAKVVEGMEVGEISSPIVYKDPKTNKDVVAIVKLKSRTLGHVANVKDDYEDLRQLVEYKKKEDVINKWIKRKISETYVFIDPNWRGCDYKYGNWDDTTNKKGIQYAN